jgi:hydrogenase maturation protease
LQQEAIPGVAVVEMGAAVLHGLAFVEQAERVLVLDAVQGGQPPGTIYQFAVGESHETPALNSLHAMGLREALRLLPPGAPRPRLTVLGMEPQSLAYGMELSPPVRGALPRIVALARETIAQWSGNKI